MFRRRDDRSEQIVHRLAMFAAIAGESAGPRGKLVSQLAMDLLFDAVLIHYERQTDRMSAAAAAKWVREKAESLVASYSPDHSAVGGPQKITEEATDGRVV